MPSPLAQAMAFQQGSPQSPGSPIAPTDVLGAYKLWSDTAEKNYQAQLAQQNAMWGGLAGLGGAGLIAFNKPISSWLSGLGGNAAAPAVGTAAAGIPGAVAGSPMASMLGNTAVPGGLLGDTSGLAGTALADAGTPIATTLAADAAVPAAADAGAGGIVGLLSLLGLA